MHNYLRSVARMRVAVVLVVILFCSAGLVVAQNPPSVITIDTKAKATPFPHFWEKMFGSGRAILSLRESYRRDLKETKQITGLEYVRFHAIFHDEVGVYDEDAQANPIYNFSYVDEIYDGLLENGVRPFIELSFTPRKLAGMNPVLHAFWYKQVVSPPKDYAKWEELIYQFTKHLTERYGEEEVSKWYFEVWNEPNIDFWAGDPKQETYFQLYDVSARAVKRVSQKYRVGGPSTAQAGWVDAFIAHCTKNNVPVDFVTSHVYGNDRSSDVFGTQESIGRDRMVCRAVAKVHDQIKASVKPDLPLIWSEFNASYMNERPVTDSTYMGPWLADTIRQCDGIVDLMSYWTFSDVFEEQGVVKQPFYGGFGLLGVGGVPKPSFRAFRLLHALGDQRIKVDSESILATRRADGTVVVAAWNLVEPNGNGPITETTLRFQNIKRNARVTINRVDASHGDTLGEYLKMGSPKYLSKKQVSRLRASSNAGAAEITKLRNGELRLAIPAHGLAVIEVK